MLTINKAEVANIYSIELFNQIHIAKDKIAIFEKKYSKDFESFEIEMRNKSENFDIYDDYIEWKAYIKLFTESQNSLQELKNDNFRVA